MNLLPHALGHALEESRAAGQDHVGEQVSAHIIIALHDGVEAVLVDTLEVVACIAWFEQNFSATETFVSNQDFAAIRQLVILFAGVAFVSFLHRGVEVANDVTHALFDIANNLELSRRGEWEAAVL